MTVLEQTLKRKIRVDGPMRFDEYMSICLSLPNQGYYQTADAVGANGDFVTAPEISQIFGEMIGLWVLQQWIDLGKPASFTLLELGPGKGTLMADAMRLAGQVDPGVLTAANVRLFEQNQTLRLQQKDALARHNPNWLDDLSDLSADDPLICIGNEFFDALPIRVFRRSKGQTGWNELYVGMDDTGQLSFQSTQPSTDITTLIPEHLQRHEDAEWYERPQMAIQFLTTLAKILAQAKGAFLFIDYGAIQPDMKSLTVQAVHNHKKVGLFETPGQTDLSAHVNFGELAKTCDAYNFDISFGTQAEFLHMSGGRERLQQLCQLATGTQRDDLTTGYERLTQKTQMGNLFKVLTVRSR